MTRYAGIDAHKADLHVTVLEEDGAEADHFTIGNEPAGFEKLIDRLHPDDQVSIEACGMAYPVVEHLLQEDIAVQVGHPTKLSTLMDPDCTDDARDSWHLADLLRRREDLGQQCGDVNRRITSLVSRYGLEPPVDHLFGMRELALAESRGARRRPGRASSAARRATRTGRRP